MVIEVLEERSIRFTDVGMGVQLNDHRLGCRIMPSSWSPSTFHRADLAFPGPFTCFWSWPMIGVTYFISM